MEKDLKDVLLKDLCARLPYYVKAEYPTIDGRKIGIIDGIYRHDLSVEINDNEYSIFDIKPYLFPLSSLTEKQRSEISQLLIDTQNTFSPYGEINTKGCDNLFVCSVKQSNAFINYCLMHHLDINGFIEKGRAIDATGLNIY